MDEVHDVQEFVEAECGSCAFVTWAAEKGHGAAGEYQIVEVDRDAVIFSCPGHDRMLVVSRHHVPGTEDLPIPQRAGVLAAVRRATGMLGRDPERVRTLADPEALDGHIRFWLYPVSLPQLTDNGRQKAGSFSQQRDNGAELPS